MTKIKGIILKGILLSLIPALCTYLSQSENILSWLQTNNYIGTEINIKIVQHITGILSILFTFGLLTVPLIISNVQNLTYKTQRDYLIKNNKEIFQNTFKKQLEVDNCKLNIRIFYKNPIIAIINSLTFMQ